MDERFIPLNYNESARYGVYDTLQSGFVVEPKYGWGQAQIMANRLNQQSEIDPEELYKPMEAKA